MLQAIGDTLPLAVGVAISPLAIVAVILLLMSPQAARSSLIFLGGWLAGLTILLIAFTLIGEAIDESDPDASKPITGTIKILLGLGLGYLAWSQWQSRPAPGESAELPSWLRAIDTFGPAKIIGLSLVFTIAAPKNIMLMAAVGKTLSNAELSSSQTIVAFAIILLLSSVTVGGPVLAFLVARDRMTPPLTVLRQWFVQNSATIMSVVLVILSANLIGKGIGNF